MGLERYGKKSIQENALLAVWDAIHNGRHVLALEKPTSKEKWFVLHATDEQSDPVSLFPAEFERHG